MVSERIQRVKSQLENSRGQLHLEMVTLRSEIGISSEKALRRQLQISLIKQAVNSLDAALEALESSEA